MFIRSVKVKGKTYYQICEIKEGKQKMIKHLGTVEKILRKFEKS